MTIALYVFAVALVVFCVCERILNTFLWLFSHSIKKKHTSEAYQVCGGVLGMGTSTATAMMAAIVRVVTVSLTALFLLLILFILLSVLSMTYTLFPVVWIHMAEYYNARIGPFVHGYILLPVQFLGLFFRGLVPLYNSFIWIGRVFINQGLLPLLFDEGRIIIDIGIACFNVGIHFSNSCIDFVEAAACVDEACLHNPPDLDLVTPMADVRTVAVLTTKLAGTVCTIMAIPADILLYPLIDINLAKAVHQAANAFLHLFVMLPITTERRCSLHGHKGISSDVLMCTPDFEPVFSRFAGATRSLGQLLDNWLAVTFGITQRTLTSVVDACPELSAIGPDTFRAGLLEGETAVVGLTEWTLAATNSTVAYFYGANQDGITPRLWPIPIDPSFGVAAVSYAEVSGDGATSSSQAGRPSATQTTTLFGCSCSDTSAGITIRCAFLPLYGTISPADKMVDVWFQDAVWVAHFSCATVEISVRSVRWPVRRFEGRVVAFGPSTTALPTTDCMTRGTCESVDATIWLVPKCSLLPAALCSSVAVGTSCFPFCMAARISGTRNANPVLVNARSWREGKQLLGRDCVLHAVGTASSSSTLASGVSTAFVGSTLFSGIAGGSNFATSSSTGALNCHRGINTLLSIVPKQNGEYRLPFVRMTGQPFAITGDTLLLEDAQPDGGAMVQVERLTGDQRDVFTLQRTFNNIKAAPKRLVPADEFDFNPMDTLVVPYEYEAARIHSTSSRNYVFYAVSPALQTFDAYLQYCSDREKLPLFQFIVFSSYGPLRVYRVRAYCEKPELCPDMSTKVDFDGFLINGTKFEPDCTRHYNATIESMEYVNEQNIAVVVQVADQTFDPQKMRGSGSQYVTYWLDPNTMSIQQTKMWRGDSAETLAEGVAACLTGPVALPRLGTIAAELVNAGVFMARFVIIGVVSAPGLVTHWRASGTTCPLDSKGHSVIASCGGDVYNLDDMFDSIEDASANFWSILSFLANVISSTPAAKVLPLTDILRGTAAIGTATVSIYEVSGGAVSLLKTPVPAQLETLFGVVMGRGTMQSAGKVVASGSAWSRFTARVLITAATSVVIAACSVPDVTISSLLKIFLHGLYDQRAAFQAIIVDRAQGGCEGVRVIFGGDNPWADVLYSLCMSSAHMLKGGYDLGMSLFVEAPMVKCVCKDAANHDIRAYVARWCAPATPTTLRPTLLSIMALESDATLLCPRVIEHVRVSILGTMEPWFGDIYDTLDALSSTVDYALIGFDDSAGQCMNFAGNSNLVVIIPAPIDYFQACGATSDCHSKCASEWSMFLEAQSKFEASSLVGFAHVTETVESRFFPTVSADMLLPAPAVAITQDDVFCGANGICSTGTDQCIAVAYPTAATDGFAIQYYCIPYRPSEGTYAGASTSAWTAAVEASDSVEDMSFLWTNGTMVVQQILNTNGNTRLQLMGKDSIGTMTHIVLNVTLGDSTCIAELNAIGVRPVRIINFLVVAGRILANVAARVNTGTTFASDVFTLWIDPWTGTKRIVSLPSDLWRGYTAVEYPTDLDLHSITATTFIFWPQASGVPLRVVFDWSGSTLSVIHQSMQLASTLAARISLVPQKLVLSKNLVRSDQYYLMFASQGSTYDWLSQLRLTRSGTTLLAAHVVNSQPIIADVEIQTLCDGTDCRACPASVRSLCAVYQSCAVFRCIGTPVNLQRPLCGIGMALRSAGMVYVQTMHGAWTMFVELFMLLLQLSTQRQLSGINLAFPDENFFGHVCAVKDLSAEVLSILASTVNSALQLAQIPGTRMQMAASIDSGSNAVLSMSTTAVTAFLNQICLLPVYMMVVGHKIMTCNVNGWIAVIGHNGVSLTLQKAELSDAEGSMVGSCLTTNAQVQAQQVGYSSVGGMIGTTVAGLVTNRAQQLIISRLEPLMHMFDGGMSYLMGIVSKFGSMLQAFDLQHCVLPDVTLPQTLRCACDDTPLTIHPHRAAEKAEDFALWCSGTLSLTDASNKQIVVYNPYSYEELRAKLVDTMEAYIQCAANSFQCTPPNDDVFAVQGVSIIPVFIRCRQNYVNRAWDPAAYVRFDQDTLDRVIPMSIAPNALDPTLGKGVGTCLLENAAKGGVGNGACLDDFMLSHDLTDVYWAYLPIESSRPHAVDACVVFSGPAGNEYLHPNKRRPFQNCLNGYTVNGSCDLSGFIWSPASGNDVPVASRHVITGNVSIASIIQQRYATARANVMSKITALQGYENENLRVGFFSAEGDLIHQLLDCVFLGPYARVDYWPQHRCTPSSPSDCLVGPYWSRDALDGSSRTIDSEHCSATSKLPFTCGSPMRKSMTSYFVQQYLLSGIGGADMINEQIRAWLNQIRMDWMDMDSYGCHCADGNTSSPFCCNASDDSPLPAKLSRDILYLNTTNVLAGIESRLHDFYGDFKVHDSTYTTYMDHVELGKYDWVNAAGAHWVEQEARYDTTIPGMRYDRQEAQSPPRGMGDDSLWYACHGALRQVLFSMPVTANGALRDPVPAFAGGGPDAIAAQVESLVQAAVESSPLYRHYVVRHHPSESTMCKQASADPPQKGSVKFSSFVVNGFTVFDGAQVKNQPVHGVDYARLGAWGSRCFCGWKITATGGCIAPVAACVSMGMAYDASGCVYFLVDQDRSSLAAHFDPVSWPCPELELSDHMGFLDRYSTEDWLLGGLNLTSSGESLLRHGQGGVVAGNIPGPSRPDTSFSVDDILKIHLTPDARLVDPEAAVLTGCDFDSRLDVLKLTDQIISGLFPMAQGITESAPIAYCMRYAIELARLRVLELALLHTSDESHVAVILQKEEVGKWMRRCGSQVQLVAMCQAMDMFHINPIASMCLLPFSVTKAASDSREVYTTPECLVFVAGTFYDPCECHPEWCTGPVVTRIGPENLTSACAMKFDPRGVVRITELAWWPNDLDDPTLAGMASDANAWLTQPWNLLDFEAFVAHALGTPRAAGNVPLGQSWQTAEGFMNETAQFCDMITDYWPDEALFPVGYHVTTPCSATDTAYRTFDNVFARDGEWLTYYDDQTRDGESIGTRFGSGGLCSGVNFGFDMYQTNTMRVCTRMSNLEEIDIHVPSAFPEAQDVFGPERCSSSNSELPWAGASGYLFYDQAFYNVGTVPHLPEPGDLIYPNPSASMWDIGPVEGIAREGWGDACEDFDLPYCDTSGGRTCPDGFYCTRGVCMQDEVQCTQHADCSDGKMCSGVGTCVQPLIVVQNWLDSNASFKGHTASCPGVNFSMVGASPWGYVPDLLVAHGMCSYRHWKEYQETLLKQGCSLTSVSACTIDATRSFVYSFDQAPVPPVNFWWDPKTNIPNRLRVIPTTCDRDYERLVFNGKELKSCVPNVGQASILTPSQAVLYSLKRERILRTYEDSRTVAIGKMPFASNSTWGFLGSNKPLSLRSCSQFHQCFADTFTQNGAESMIVSNIRKPSRTLLNSQPYDANDIFRCGFIGYSTNSGCVVDPKLFPLYSTLCFEGIPASCASILDTSRPYLQQASVLCSIIKTPYQPSVAYIEETLVPSLAGLFYVFVQPSTLQQHVLAVDCMKQIYSTISVPPYTSKGLYFPFAFTVYEFPFPWFYQCVLGSGITPDIKKQKTYACPPYQGNTNKVKPDTFEQHTGQNDEFQNYIRFVRGGYTQAGLSLYAAQNADSSKRVWSTCVNKTMEKFYGPVDKSKPMCYQNQYWILDDTTKDQNLRTIIGTMVSNVCAAARQIAALRAYNNLVGGSYTLTSIMSILVKNTGVPIAQSHALTLLQQIDNYGTAYLEQSKRLERLSVSRITSEKKTPVTFDATIPSGSNLLDTLLKTHRYQPIANVLEATSNCTPARARYAIDLVSLGDGSDMMICPIYQQGMLGCGYPPIRNAAAETLAPTYTNLIIGDWIDTFTAYFNTLFSDVSTCYDANRPVIEPAVPETLSFFEEEYSLSFAKPFSFDLTKVNIFQNNINPDPTAPLMCVIGNQSLDFAKCTDLNYATLKKHVASTFVRDGAVIIPSMEQLTWTINRDMLTQGSIFSYASVDRSLSKQFVWQLFDDSTSCASDVSLNQRICSFESTGAIASVGVITPWLDGYWNPYDQCDVSQTDINDGYTEYIDVDCAYTEKCPENNMYVDYYQSMPNWQFCKNNQGKKTSQLNVDKSTSYNLCTQRLEQDQICMHDQGMVGGTDGIPTFDYTQGDMYTLNQIVHSSTDAISTIFSDPLFSGQQQDYGLLQVPLNYIGGNTIGMRIYKGAMHITKIPLKPFDTTATMMDVWDSKPVTEWVKALPGSFSADDAVYRLHLKQASQFFGWDCPLRRRAYYGGTVAGFAPSLPSARRSRRLFGNLTGDTYAHPTQIRAHASERFGDYMTTNGFCFCPSQKSSEGDESPPGSCSVPVYNQSGHPCSLFNTINAISGVSWVNSYTFPLRSSDLMLKKCTMQLDWPFVGGNLRDGSTLLDKEAAETVWAKGSSPELQYCHVLDRMRPFSYTYRSVNELRPSGMTTLSAGVCHTGRAQNGFPASNGRCIRTGKSYSIASLKCDSDPPTTVSRKVSTLPREAASKSKFSRQRCGQCSPPPKFRTRAGAPIPQQSSFGIPYRLSAERSLANDLVRALCSEPGISTADCIARLNASAWQPGVFLPTYLATPRQLLRSAYNATPIADAFVPSSSVPADEALWAHPWVYCPSRTALRTGVCNGSIPKALWRSRKVQTCHAAIDDALKGQPDPMGKTSVCNMDSVLSSLCAAIEEAKTLVAGANCLASGNPKCTVQEFVYNPSTWEVTNQEFVHQTVLKYYALIDPSVCPVPDDMATLIAHNSEIVKDCAAVPVFTFYAVIQGLRNMIDTIVQSFGHAVNLVFQLFLTLVTKSRDDASAQAVVSWRELKRLTSTVMGTVSDLVLDLAFTSGTSGPWLRRAMGDVCAFGNSAYRYFRDVYCSLIITSLPSLLLGVKSMSTWVQIGFQVLNDFMDVVMLKLLPKAFVSLLKRGYAKGFQTTQYLATREFYSSKNEQVDPHEKTPRQSRPLSQVQREAANPPADNRVMKNLANTMHPDMDANNDPRNNVVKNERDKLNKQTPGTVSSSGIVAAAGSVVAGYELINGVYVLVSSALEGQAALDELNAAFPSYPDSWTLFDFSLLFGVIDDMMNFLETDITCYNPSHVDPLTCSFLGLAELNSTEAEAMAPAASQCWAEAQERQVGITTLYACTAASTCLKSPTASEVVLCLSCPPNSNPLFHTYGCNTMLQLCQCGTQALDVTGCVAHRDCAAPDTACSVLSALGDVSFGTIKCSDCSNPPVCLLDKGFTGKCTCLSSGSSELDVCSVPTGQAIIPSPSRLCGYAYDPSAYYFWSDLALVLCTRISSAICAEVTSDTMGTFFLAVGSRATMLRRSRMLLASSNESLLQPPEALSPETRRHKAFSAWVVWNHTAAPCAGLALAAEAQTCLGPMDSAAADACIYWRSAGRQIIIDHNLTELEPFDHFLLSAEDFAGVLQQRGVLHALFRHPDALLDAALYTPLLQPLKSMHKVLLHLLHRRHWFDASRHNHTLTPTKNTRTAKNSRRLPAVHEMGKKESKQNGSTTSPASRKTLSLFSDVVASLEASPIFKPLATAAARITLPEVPARISILYAQSSLRGPFAWPRVYFDGLCPPVQAVAVAIARSMTVVHTYYVRFPEIAAAPAAPFRIFPDFTAPANWTAETLRSVQGAGTNAKSIATWAFDATLAAVGMTTRDLAFFLSDPCGGEDCSSRNRITLLYALDTALSCDFEAVMYCNLHTRDLFSSSVFALVVYLVLAFIGSATGLTILPMLFFMASPAFILWYSFGLSIGCVPMLPTCFIDSFIASASAALPLNVSMPSLLLDCAPAPCLRSCASLGFSAWSDPLVFFACSLGLGPLLQDYVADVAVKQAMTTSPDSAAYAVCAVVSSASSIPFLMLAGSILTAVWALVTLILELLPPLASLLWHVVAYSHARAAEPE